MTAAAAVAARTLDSAAERIHPSYVMSSSFANQTIAQIELFLRTADYPVGVYTLPKHLDEKVARLQLKTLNAQLSELTDEQAAYISVPKEGPPDLAMPRSVDCASPPD